MELLAHDQEQKRRLGSYSFWQKENREALYQLGPDNTPVNFTVRVEGRYKAIPYRVAAPMAWEYPYAHGQAQESITDRLVTASLCGMQLVRPGYTAITAPESRPVPIPASK